VAVGLGTVDGVSNVTYDQLGVTLRERQSRRKRDRYPEASVRGVRVVHRQSGRRRTAPQRDGRVLSTTGSNARLKRTSCSSPSADITTGSEIGEPGVTGAVTARTTRGPRTP